jgi:squalene synthase HpnC
VAFQYCESLVKSNYENFFIGTLFLPKKSIRHFHSIYAYCRMIDDFGDEISGDSSNYLNYVEDQLDLCYQGKPDSLIFHALYETVSTFNIPQKLFYELIQANRIDQQVNRYNSIIDLLNYCEKSANPVGQLVLYVLGFTEDDCFKFSNLTCIGLQLTNFWQDIQEDYNLKKRIYLPKDDMEYFEYSEEDLKNHRYNQNFIRLMEFQIDRTFNYFYEGIKLLEYVNGRSRIEVAMFNLGGLAILEKIKKRKYNVFLGRPKLNRWNKLIILFRSLLISNRLGYKLFGYFKRE